MGQQPEGKRAGVLEKGGHAGQWQNQVGARRGEAGEPTRL